MTNETQSRKKVTRRFDAKAKLMEKQMQNLEERLNQFATVEYNCEKTRTMTDEKLGKYLNNTKLADRIRKPMGKGFNERDYFDYVGCAWKVSYKDLAKSKDPLCMKIYQLTEEKFEYKDPTRPRFDLTHHVSQSYAGSIIEKIKDRSMTEKDYMGHLNGEKPIGFIDIRNAYNYETANAVFLNPDSKDGKIYRTLPVVILGGQVGTHINYEGCVSMDFSDQGIAKDPDLRAKILSKIDQTKPIYNEWGSLLYSPKQ